MTPLCQSILQLIFVWLVYIFFPTKMDEQLGQPRQQSTLTGIDLKIASTKHYFSRLLKLNGEQLFKFQNVHIMIIYFCTYGLDLTDSLDQSQKEKIRGYILSLELPQGGFTCNSYYTSLSGPNNPYALPHIVFTYSAINTLSMVGGLDKIDKKTCLQSVAKCQKENGSYSSFMNSDEADLRFVYSAVSICHTFGDFSRMDVEKVVSFIESCFNFDGGYGLRPFCESHSGAIYCAVAALKMLGRQPQNKKRILNFLANRQTVNLAENDIVGVQGRVGKFPDSCYSFWVGASIKILTGQNLLNPAVESFINLCYMQTECSFKKYPTSEHGDPVHSCHSLVGVRLARGNVEDIDLERGIKRHK